MSKLFSYCSACQWHTKKGDCITDSSIFKLVHKCGCFFFCKMLCKFCFYCYLSKLNTSGFCFHALLINHRIWTIYHISDCFSGYQYAGVQYKEECWCGRTYGKFGTLPDTSCSAVCPGNQSETCGGYNAQRIFSTGLPGKVYEKIPQALLQNANTTLRIIKCL